MFPHFSSTKIFLFRVVRVTRSKLINEGESVQLLCQVDGFPQKADTIKWRRDGYDFGELSQITGNHKR